MTAPVYIARVSGDEPDPDGNVASLESKHDTMYAAFHWVVDQVGNGLGDFCCGNIHREGGSLLCYFTPQSTEWSRDGFRRYEESEAKS